ncbi:CsbD family protein [Marinicella sp. S1101]|uniref:CsbD family protein n=1 Tax=Marinicella marina TaxID=2996016 RepID=UPI002260C965|nr:CsbD family protein [Marinicella marina]MCX7552680.1 CsbD family protein [Marinicella marina]MDJ1139556.1 CsbD family protein [Marinicella marina]
MNWDIVEGKWERFKGEAQIKWGKLTDDDLDVISGNKTKLAGKIQEKYGYSKERAEEAAEEWKQTLES